MAENDLEGNGNMSITKNFNDMNGEKSLEEGSLLNSTNKRKAISDDIAQNSNLKKQKTNDSSSGSQINGLEPSMFDDSDDERTLTIDENLIKNEIESCGTKSNGSKSHNKSPDGNNIDPESYDIECEEDTLSSLQVSSFMNASKNFKLLNKLLGYIVNTKVENDADLDPVEKINKKGRPAIHADAGSSRKKSTQVTLSPDVSLPIDSNVTINGMKAFNVVSRNGFQSKTAKNIIPISSNSTKRKPVANNSLPNKPPFSPLIELKKHFAANSPRPMFSKVPANKHSNNVLPSTVAVKSSGNNVISVSSTSSTPKTSVESDPKAGREASPEIEVVSEKKTTKPSYSTDENQNHKSPYLTTISYIALLKILTRPFNMHPVHVAVRDRKDLDAMVKTTLMKPHFEFIEWLFGMRLLKEHMTCYKHKGGSGAIKLVAANKSSPVQPNGGYLWMVDCCQGGRKYVSVCSGSIFAIGLKEKISSTSVLKLIYHWSCQTTINNVENWVKVSLDIISRSYNYFRCVCTVLLHDNLYDLGSGGGTVELGIVSLGTTNPDGNKKAVKVEILGLYDRKNDMYRLFASSPKSTNTSSQRFMRILKPVLSVVHHSAGIVCDQSIDRTCLPMMNYRNVIYCSQNNEGTTENSNSKIMSYLRKHIPKMFQNTLSTLNLEQVQLILDELCWREIYGKSPSHSYVNILKHLAYITVRESNFGGVLSFLDYVAVNPHKLWRYLPEEDVPELLLPPPTVPELPKAMHPLPQTHVVTFPAQPFIHPAVDVDGNARSRNPNTNLPIDVDLSNLVVPHLHNNKMARSSVLATPGGSSNDQSAKNPPSKTQNVSSKNVGNTSTNPQSKIQNSISKVIEDNSISTSSLKSANPSPTKTADTSQPIQMSASDFREKCVELVSYYYGEVKGDEKLGREVNFCELKCHKCSFKTRDNINFYQHMKGHLLERRLIDMLGCRYCILQFPDHDTYRSHIKSTHDPDVEETTLCRICMITFTSEELLITHMTKMHVEADLPYRCDVCNYSTSYFKKLADHFVEEHRGSPYILCHFCLMVKVVSPGSEWKLGNWLLNHLVDHTKGLRCNSCVVSLKKKSKAIVQAHMMYHASQKQNKDLVRYTTTEPIFIHKQRIKTTGSEPKVLYSHTDLKVTQEKANIAMSAVVEMCEGLTVEDTNLCKECEAPMNKPGHYSAYQKCVSCSYHTSCSVMMPHHNYVFHNLYKKKKVDYNLGPAIIFRENLVCNCGFASKSGNHLARHMTRCRGGNKTAYREDTGASPVRGTDDKTVRATSVLPTSTENRTTLKVASAMQMTPKVGRKRTVVSDDDLSDDDPDDPDDPDVTMQELSDED